MLLLGSRSRHYIKSGSPVRNCILTFKLAIKSFMTEHGLSVASEAAAQFFSLETQ